MLSNSAIPHKMMRMLAGDTLTLALTGYEGRCRLHGVYKGRKPPYADWVRKCVEKPPECT